MFDRVRYGALTPVPYLWTVRVPFPCDRGCGPVAHAKNPPKPPDHLRSVLIGAPEHRRTRRPYVEGERGHRQPPRPRPHFP